MDPNGEVEPTEVVDQPVEDGSSESGLNPAWNDLLGELPENLHHLVTPHLSKWDKNFQEKFQETQQQNSVYEPYQELVENQVDPQAIQQALAVMNMLNDKPDEFFKEMQTFYKDDPRFQALTPQQQQEVVSQGDPEFDLGTEAQQQKFNLESDPRFQQIQQQQEIIAQFLTSQVQAEEVAQEDAALDADLTSLSEKYGEYDEDYVLGLAQSGVDLEQAVKRYKSMEAKFRSTPAPGSNFPPVVTPGGGVPSTAIDPSGMNSHDTQNLIASYLASQNE